MEDVSEPKISWVIPVIPKDLMYLPELLRACDRQTRPIFEVVLVGSGLRRAERKRVVDLVQLHGVQVRMVFRALLHSAGSNRNTGVKAASGDWVSFLDADDVPAPSRNSVITKALLGLSDPERWVLMHSFEKRSREDGPLSHNFEDVLGHGNSAEMLYELTADRIARLRGLKMRRGRLLQGNRYVLMRFEGATSNGPHHAAITVTKATASRVGFPRRPLTRDEDVAFVNQLWQNGLKFCFIDESLMIYRQGLSTGPGDELKLVNPFWRLELLRRKAVASNRWIWRRYRRILRRLVTLRKRTIGDRVHRRKSARGSLT